MSVNHMQKIESRSSAASKKALWAKRIHRAFAFYWSHNEM